MPAKINVTKSSRKATKKAVKKAVNKASKKTAKKVAKKAARKTARKTAKKVKVPAQVRHEMIATAAYYLAENRGFQGGDALGDWLTGEIEIDVLLSK